MPRLERDGDVHHLDLDADDENRFHPDWLSVVESALDEVEKASGPRVLVTSGSGKFWSNGLDLDWLSAHEDQFATYVDRVHALFARTLSSPVVSVAALNGHVFAAGAMWALAHDFRVMRADRGYFCLPEVDLDLSFQPGMSELVRARLAPRVAHEAMTTGRRYGGREALEAGIVDAVADADAVRSAAVEHVRPLAAKSTPVRGQIKQTLFSQALATLAIPTPAPARAAARSHP